MDYWVFLELLLWCLLILVLIWLVLAPLYASPRWAISTMQCGKCTQFCPSQSQVNLVSNKAGMAYNVNPFFQGSWGLALASEGTHVWTTQQASGVLLNMSLGGTQIGSTITVPHGTGTSGSQGYPNGVTVANWPRCAKGNKCRRRRGKDCTCVCASTGGTGFIAFPIVVNGVSAEAEVIVGTEDGTIAGYNATLNPTEAIRVVDNSTIGAIYKGCLRVQDTLYVCNFFEGKIDVYNSNWQLVSSFTDPQLQTGEFTYAPYNITWDAESKRLYVSFAMQSANKEVAEPGQGNGYIVIFDSKGAVQKRLISRGMLNLPAGLAIRGELLYVANNGDGSIIVFHKCTGAYRGQFLTSSCRVPKLIEQIHSIIFCPKSRHRDSACCREGAMMFVSAPDGGTDGLMGLLRNRKAGANCR